jgi:hypothetical protein
VTAATTTPRAAASVVAPAAPATPDIEGEVVDPDDKPAAGATVTCKLADREFTAEADAAGAFHLTGDAAGCAAVATKRRFKPSDETALGVGSGARNRLRLHRPTGIAGHVVDDAGTPVLAFWMTITSADADAGAPRHFADMDGAFEIVDLAPGRYALLVVSAPPGPMARVGPIAVVADTLTDDLRVTLLHGVTVAGRVTDAATHAPVEGAKVYVLFDGLSTDQPRTKGGDFELTDAPTEPFDLRVSGMGYKPTMVPGLHGHAGERLHVDVRLERWPQENGDASATPTSP